MGCTALLLARSVADSVYSDTVYSKGATCATVQPLHAAKMLQEEPCLLGVLGVDGTSDARDCCVLCVVWCDVCVHRWWAGLGVSVCVVSRDK